MTLLLLAIAAVLMGRVGRLSSEAALTTNAERNALQRRWARRSVRQTLLPHADPLIRQASKPGQPARPSVSHTLELGRLTVHCVLADERAKLDLNQLLQRRGEASVREAIGQLLTRRGQGLRVDLKPIPVRQGTSDASGGEAGDPQGELRLPSFGQVFAKSEPRALIGFANASRGEAVSRGARFRGARFQKDALPELPGAALLTCWGNGRANIRRAPIAVLRQYLNPPLTLSHIEQLQELRQQQPRLSVHQLMEALGLDQARRQRVRPLITDRSESYSLWQIMVAQGRRHHYLAIQRAGEGSPELTTFAW